VDADYRDSDLRALICAVAESFGTDELALRLKACLHVPRLAKPDSEIEPCVALAEVERLASQQLPIEAFRLPEFVALSELRFACVEHSTAKHICERLHYIGSHRSGATPYGLLTPAGRVAALALVVACDVDVPRSLADHAFGDAAPRVLARVFSFNGCPPNTLSRLLGLVGRAERARGTKSLVTYVNPNLGFTGSSYRAANWTFLGDEPGTVYSYRNGKYVTDRNLARSLAVTVGRTPRGSVTQSTCDLEPLLIYGVSVDRRRRSGA
jgi:hypothetical protein